MKNSLMEVLRPLWHQRNEVDSLLKNRTEQFEYLRTNVRPSLSILVFNPIII